MRFPSSLMLGLATLAGSTSSALAALTCVAQERCRGDALTMCAPSHLEIKAEKDPASGPILWINKQGPYKASQSKDGGVMTFVPTLFSKSHRLEVLGDLSFLYVGNAGKRFTGTCKGAF